MVRFIPIHLSGYTVESHMDFIFNVIFSCITLNSFTSVISLNALVKLYPQNVLHVELYTLEMMFML